MTEEEMRRAPKPTMAERGIDPVAAAVKDYLDEYPNSSWRTLYGLMANGGGYKTLASFQTAMTQRFGIKLKERRKASAEDAAADWQEREAASDARVAALEFSVEQLTEIVEGLVRDRE